jgi:hypothetical protein
LAVIADGRVIARVQGWAAAFGGLSMRAFSIFFVAFIFGSATAAFGRDVKVGNSTIKVTPPAGYCELDQAIKADRNYLKSATDIDANAGLTLFAAFPDCKELKEMRASNAFVATKVLITAETNSIGKANANSVTDTCKELKEQGDKLAADNNKSMQDNVKTNSVNTLQNNQFLGVLDDKGDVCFSAQLITATTPKGRVRNLNLFATTLLGNNIIFLYSFSPYVDATSVASGLANLKVIYADFVAANPK